MYVVEAVVLVTEEYTLLIVELVEMLVVGGGGVVLVLDEEEVVRRLDVLDPTIKVANRQPTTLTIEITATNTNKATSDALHRLEVR